jgi:hypothetical protein
MLMLVMGKASIERLDFTQSARCIAVTEEFLGKGQMVKTPVPGAVERGVKVSVRHALEGRYRQRQGEQQGETQRWRPMLASSNMVLRLICLLKAEHQKTV